jgi:nitric oxide reductase NorD protein
MTNEGRYGLREATPGLRHYLRALWAKNFSLQSTDKPATVQRPFLSELGIHLPERYASHSGNALRDLYWAAAAHAAAHLAYSDTRFERKQLKPVQLAIIGLLEDARVESRAIAEMPGLRRLWLKFFDDRSRQSESVDALLIRLSHCLLDPARRDDHPWVRKACDLYAASQQSGSHAPALREVGSLLGNDLGQMRAQFNARAYLVEPAYRDDNVFLWRSETPPEETRLQDSGFRSTDEVAQSTPRLDEQVPEDADFRPREIATTSPDEQGRMQSDRPVYPEWDARIGRWRERWCTIIEHIPDVSDAANATALRDRLSEHDALVSRLSGLLQARKRGLPHRLRHETKGDDFELDALIGAQLALRTGQTPDLRIFRRTRLQKPDLSVLLLLELSASVNTQSGDATRWSLICEASLLLGAAIELGGDQLAIHGFRSNGRHEVNYLRFKEFHDPLDDQVTDRLANVEGALSTRLGAAIRHASHSLRQCRTAQRMILLITDGEPHDIDVFHPEILVQDAGRAIAQSGAEGSPVFCVSVDKQADLYLQRMFGKHHYLLVESIDQLPERLPALYLRLNA